MATVRYLLALLGLTVGTLQARPRWALASVAMMFGNNLVFYLVWVIESVIVLAKLCFFFLRFSFRL